MQFVIPRNEESPREARQRLTILIVELLAGIASPVHYRSCPRSE